MQKLIKPLFISLALCLILIYFYIQQKSPQELEIYFLDVGQGDAVLIRTPEQQDILIDGGPDQKVLSELERILPFWDRDLELVILTHAHDDHLIGLISVLEQYQVKKIIFNPVENQNNFYQEFYRLIQEKNIPTLGSFAGDNIILGEQTTLQTLYPFKALELSNLESQNDASLVNLLTYKNNKILFTGDISAETEVQIFRQEQKIDLLKVAHHGSKYSSSPEFLAATRPAQAIISCGADNDFGHPHFAALWRLENLGAHIFRTDEQGTIKCLSTGLDIECQKMI